jgi:hypothetical protein
MNVWVPAGSTRSRARFSSAMRLDSLTEFPFNTELAFTDAREATWSRRSEAMAFDGHHSRTELGNVEAPSRLFDPVTDVLDRLNRRVLWESAKLARARVGSGHKCAIESEDVLNAVHAVLADAASEIQKALGGDESRFARRAS